MGSVDHFVKFFRVMGRPVLQEEARRTVQVNIRLTVEEDRKIRRYAEASGITPANWIRQKVFTGKFPIVKISPVDAALYRELNRIGINLNQAVRLVHGGKQNADLLPLLSELQELEKELVRLLLL